MDNRGPQAHQVTTQFSRGTVLRSGEKFDKGSKCRRESLCADQVDRVSDSERPLRAAQFLKPPALPGDTYLAPHFFALSPSPAKLHALRTLLASSFYRGWC